MFDEKLLDSEIKRMFDGIAFAKEPAGLYDPLRYMIEIGGKRIRPRLCLTAYALFAEGGLAGAGVPILEPACGLEVFHTFTLLHDDIMDRSPLRRGQETVWKKWNEDTAILSGDVMLIDAYKRIAKAPADKTDAVLKLFSDTAAEVCEGQQYDMEFESLPEVQMLQYEQMIKLKTAVLLACSAKMGAIIAGARDGQCEALYKYGLLLGMAFQVADDYLDAYGDEKVFGKPIGGDILNCKKSWLTVRTCEKAGDKRAFLEMLSADASSPEEKAAKIAAVMEVYNKYGVGEDARAEVRRYSDLAIEAVAGFEPWQREALARFADSLVARAK